MSLLTPSETTLLSAAAERPDGLLLLPERMKPATRARLLGQLVRDGLVRPQGDAHRITVNGYRALGLVPPRRKAVASAADGTVDRAAPSDHAATRPGTKLERVRTLLARPDGATLAELVEATGWLPHTTRAALSRLRSAGQPLAKPARPDGTLAYRIEVAAPATPDPAPARRARRKAVSEAVQAAA